MIERDLEVYRKTIPESYIHNFSITISSKESEIEGIEYDLMCVLYDALHNHTNFKNVKIHDFRNLNKEKIIWFWCITKLKSSRITT